MIPCIMFLIYRILTRKPDYSQYLVKERYSTYWDAMNLFDLNPYKKRPHIDQINEAIAKKEESKKPFLEEDVYDRWFRLFIFICAIYYLADVVIKLYELRFPQDYTDMCKLGFFGHHLATLYGFKSIFSIDHYTWFLSGPMSYHTFLVTFPSIGLVNNVIYLSFVAIWMYKTL